MPKYLARFLIDGTFEIEVDADNPSLAIKAAWDAYHAGTNLEQIRESLEWEADDIHSVRPVQTNEL